MYFHFPFSKLYFLHLLLLLGTLPYLIAQVFQNQYLSIKPIQDERFPDCS